MSRKKTVVITGCGGMLGEAVYRQFLSHWNVHASDIDLNEPWLEYLDVTGAPNVAKHIERVKPDAIIHLAALTDMEYCQSNSEHAYQTNTLGVAYALAPAVAHGIPFVYISTAGIFDGEKKAYKENDIPNPLNIYGKSKYAGEVIVRTYPKSITIRAGWMMGGGPTKDKKFINKIIKQLNAEAKELNVLSDKFGTPCYTYDLARTIEYLITRKAYGLYHGACNGGGHRLDVARFIISKLGLEKKIKVNEVDSSYWQKEYFAPRPASERLTNIILKKLNPKLTRHWRICLAEYLERFDWLGKNI